MRALWVVLRKELLDAFRDRRMVAVAFLVMPLAVPLVLACTAALGPRKQAANGRRRIGRQRRKIRLVRQHGRERVRHVGARE